MRANYPSDISPEKCELIRPLLESARRTTRPRTVDLYEVFCAVLYLLRTGCQWLTRPRAIALVQQVARTVDRWEAHFRQHGVCAADLERLRASIDREALRWQRKAFC
ncbi:MAG: transposase [Burkholderiaceae bacterium]|nr:transposase [Burkholderiaceae bacterium]